MIYVTGKTNARVMRRVLARASVRLVVDARQPLVYSKWIDIAYLPLIRIRLWRSLANDVRENVLRRETQHWLMPEASSARPDQGGPATQLSFDVRPGAKSNYRRVWILTNLEAGLETESGPDRVRQLLTRVGVALHSPPEELRTRLRPLRVGFFHEDLSSHELGFERLALVLKEYFKELRRAVH